MKDKQWDLDELMSIVEGEIEARERAAVTIANLYKTLVRVTPPTAAALMAGGGASGVSYCFCRQSHTSASCSIVTDVAERKLLLRRSGSRSTTWAVTAGLAWGVIIVTVGTMSASVQKHLNLQIVRPRLQLLQVRTIMTSQRMSQHSSPSQRLAV